MTAKLHIYSHGLTGHIAWQLDGAYFSFHPGEKISDLGSMDLPLPSGAKTCKVSAHRRQLRDEEHDRATYRADKNSSSVIELPGLNAVAAAMFIQDFMDSDLPYILWDNKHDVGAINCVTTSIMIFHIALPLDWPSGWDSTWGDSFRRLRELAKQNDDWIEEAIRKPVPELMQVSQFHQMALDWANAFTADTTPPAEQ